jgi:L-fuconolactonase
MRVDAHQHFWSLQRGDYGWLTPALAPLYRDFAPADLANDLRAADIAGTVLVQAAPTLAETRWLLDLAARTDSVLGVVGWVDLASAEAPFQLEALCTHSKFKGVRPMLQDLPDDAWIATAPIERALRHLAALGLCFDALVKPRHLPHLLQRLQQHPELPVVIDHAAKPDIVAGDWRAWRERLQPLAALPQVCCKLSGLLTEAPLGSGVSELQPYVDSVLESFGARRVMWGSDWPVLNLASSYAGWMALTDELLRSLAPDERSAVQGGTAIRFYRLQPTTTEETRQ